MRLYSQFFYRATYASLFVRAFAYLARVAHNTVLFLSFFAQLTRVLWSDVVSHAHEDPLTGTPMYRNTQLGHLVPPLLSHLSSSTPSSVTHPPTHT